MLNTTECQSRSLVESAIPAILIIQDRIRKIETKKVPQPKVKQTWLYQQTFLVKEDADKWIEDQKMLMTGTTGMVVYTAL